MEYTMLKLKLIFLLFSITATQADELPLLEISNGWLQGTLEKSYNGRIYSSFEGIPYARPPIGELRFEAPKEPYNWTGTWIANTKHTCLYSMASTITGDEDCLYVNVYVPRAKPNPSDNLNVIVHIHGGGFMMWSSHVYAGPQYLMDEEVIFVTMNYRLGAFGFLSTVDEVAPGNNGLKDQALSLKWIQNNIKYFGGNPDSVTITGMSAGGASVHYHYFSPISKGLFHRGLSQSGNALDPWAFETSPLSNAKKLAEHVGCPTDTSRELVDCLKSRSGIKLAEAQDVMLSIDTPGSGLMFTPVVEPEVEGAFLTQHPYKMLLDKTVTDVPWVVSVTEEEGVFLAMFTPKPLPEYFENFDKFAPGQLYYNNIVDETEKAAITKKIKEHYFEEAMDFSALASLLSDRLFVAGADTSAKLQAKANKSPVYFYRLGYRGQHTFAEYMIPQMNNTVTTHGDDVLYYLHTKVAEKKLSETDEKMKSVYLQWLLAYADNQEPKPNGVTWDPVSGGEILEFLYFETPDEIVMEVAEGFGANALWSKLPLKENEQRRTIRDEL